MSARMCIAGAVFFALLAMSVPWVFSYVLRDVETYQVWYGFPAFVTSLMTFIGSATCTMLLGFSASEKMGRKP